MSVAEIAFQQALRALDKQSADLENTRGHVNIIITAAGLAATILGSQARHHDGWPFAFAGAAFAVIAGLTTAAYWHVNWAESFDGYKLVKNFVDADPQLAPEAMFRDLTIYATDDYRYNRPAIRRLLMIRLLALFAFVVEVIALLVAVRQ